MKKRRLCIVTPRCTQNSRCNFFLYDWIRGPVQKIQLQRISIRTDSYYQNLPGGSAREPQCFLKLVRLHWNGCDIGNYKNYKGPLGNQQNERNNCKPTWFGTVAGYKYAPQKTKMIHKHIIILMGMVYTNRICYKFRTSGKRDQRKTNHRCWPCFCGRLAIGQHYMGALKKKDHHIEKNYELQFRPISRNKTANVDVLVEVPAR